MNADHDSSDVARARRGAWGRCAQARLAAIAIFLALPVPAAQAQSSADAAYIQWLESQSMLHRAEELAHGYSGSGKLWRRSYAQPQPRGAAGLASVWFTAYPAATITHDGESVIAALGDDQLWKAFQQIGIRAIHTGPMKRGGGIAGHQFTPSIDGNFDRISNDIDPLFGSEEEYLRLTARARERGGIVISDVIPGHTGKGADFRLAERAVGDYPGLYHMVEIDRDDWSHLPAVPAGRDSVNLPPQTVDALARKGYLVGQLQRTIFYQKGVKESDFSATPVIRGADGRERRWVYLHYFKEGQPSLNWLDPTFAAERLVVGDALHSLGRLGDSMLRLDANGFLGIEPREGSRAWSEGHPLSNTANRLIAGIVRKLGGFTFQELNLSLDDLRDMSAGGADLSYDFVTRPAYHEALVDGDTEFLRLMLRLMHSYGIDPAGLIHALQNHDELTLELVHFWTTHKNDRFKFRGRDQSGTELRELIRGAMLERLTGARAPYNLEAPNGIACTTVSLIAAALGVADLTAISGADRARITRAHLLLAMYNALQPGVFALSGWDLVGAMPLPTAAVATRLRDGDTRWIQRGAYDLLGVNRSATESSSGIPRAPALYGTLSEQFRDPWSFASQLKAILDVRQRYEIYKGEQIEVPNARARGLLLMVHRLPNHRGLEVTALNFGRSAIDENVQLQSPEAVGRNVIDLMSGARLGTVTQTGTLRIRLQELSGRALLIK